MNEFQDILKYNNKTSIAKALEKRNQLLTMIFYEIACKTSEIIEIKVKDISEKNIRIKKRIIPISANLNKYIEIYIKENKLVKENPLFFGRQSCKITPKRVRQIIQKSSKFLTGLKINPKDIRNYSIFKNLKFSSKSRIREIFGLKRVNKIESIDEKKIKKLIKKIKNKRNFLLFNLLIRGISPKEISKLKVNKIRLLNIKESFKISLLNFSKKNNLSNQEFLFKTRQKSALTKERIFQIIKSYSNTSKINFSPRILNKIPLKEGRESNFDEKLELFEKLTIQNHKRRSK